MCVLRYTVLTHQTYSGLFLVVINPYQWFPIYTEEVIRKYVKRQRGEVPPHTYSSADEAYRYLLKDHKSQSLLVTYAFLWPVYSLIVVVNQVPERPKTPNA